ncbi:hypothetical protein GCK32_020506 [Trichostrongylus colubriformis]|uniref:Uncharacterized protein n=1 Tax=Trichostrongylus colubriformis TaxID=6319 RepID=A0AAN8FPQ5_TRICO
MKLIATHTFKVEIGTTKTIGGRIYRCAQISGGARIQLTDEPTEHASCGDHKYGEEFMFEKYFKVKCAAYGTYELLSCVVDGEHHRVGTTFKLQNHDFKCVVTEAEGFRIAPADE